MKYDVEFTNKFKKELKIAKKQNKDLNKLYDVIEKLANGEALDIKYRDHELAGKYKGTRECHIVLNTNLFTNNLFKLIKIN